MADHDVIVVGAGLAGLLAARTLNRAGADVAVFEAAEHVGGRVHHCNIDGYVIDDGFQVLITSYEAAIRHLDLDALRLQQFPAGARVWTGHGMKTVADPIRHPKMAFATLRSGVFSVGDIPKLLRWGLAARSAPSIREFAFSQSEASGAQYLRKTRGFSERLVNQLLTPFFAGITLDEQLACSSRMIDFVFAAFAQGRAAIPEKGMGMISSQLADGLPSECVSLGRRATAVDAQSVTLADGDRITANAVLVATGGWDAHRLLNLSQSAMLGADRPPQKTTSLYYAIPAGIDRSPLLSVNGIGPADGPINNAVVLSNTARSYAPPNRQLVVASVLGNAARHVGVLDHDARMQLAKWLGCSTHDLALVDQVDIPHALPNQAPPWLISESWNSQLSNGVFVAGDWCDTASIDGALHSGERAAQSILNQIR